MNRNWPREEGVSVARQLYLGRSLSAHSVLMDKEYKKDEKARRQLCLARRKYTLEDRAGNLRGQDQPCSSEYLLI